MTRRDLLRNSAMAPAAFLPQTAARARHFAAQHSAADGRPVARRLPGRRRQPRHPHAEPGSTGRRRGPLHQRLFLHSHLHAGARGACSPASRRGITACCATPTSARGIPWKCRAPCATPATTPPPSASCTTIRSAICTATIRRCWTNRAASNRPDFRSDYRSWFWSQAPNLDPDATGLGWNDFDARPYALPERLHPTAWTGQTAAAWIDSYQRPEPFFLKVSFARPHSPYDPPERFWRRYQDADLPAAAVAPWAKRFAPRSGPQSDAWHGDLGAEQVRRSRQGYYGSVTFVDEQIGRILEALSRRKLMEETLIIFFSDHGDMLGDHHLWRKSYAYAGSARVPMMVRWPEGMLSARRGSTLDQMVELRDVLPTFLDAAGAPPARPLDGRSLLPLIGGKDSEWRSFLDLEHGVCYGPENHWNALADARHKYIFHALDASEQLFDLARDPGELHDLAGRSRVRTGAARMAAAHDRPPGAARRPLGARRPSGAASGRSRLLAELSGANGPAGPVGNLSQEFASVSPSTKKRHDREAQHRQPEAPVNRCRTIAELDHVAPRTGAHRAHCVQFLHRTALAVHPGAPSGIVGVAGHHQPRARQVRFHHEDLRRARDHAQAVGRAAGSVAPRPERLGDAWVAVHPHAAARTEHFFLRRVRRLARHTVADAEQARRLRVPQQAVSPHRQ